MWLMFVMSLTPCVGFMVKHRVTYVYLCYTVSLHWHGRRYTLSPGSILVDKGNIDVWYQSVSRLSCLWRDTLYSLSTQEQPED